MRKCRKIVMIDIDLSQDEIQRYSRHILLRELGGKGQVSLKTASVLVVGVGGLGSVVALYLAAAGVGRIGLIDDDKVELSNLQRQILYDTASIEQKKVSVAAKKLEALNPHVCVEVWDKRLDTAGALDIIQHYDLVCDGSDNFETRYSVNAACVQAHKPLIVAAVQGFGGQITAFRPQQGCYHCLYPQESGSADVPTCSQAGVLGAVVGLMGTMQATEALKELAGLGTSLVGRLVCLDALVMRFSEIPVGIDPCCSVCRSGFIRK